MKAIIETKTDEFILTLQFTETARVPYGLIFCMVSDWHRFKEGICFIHCDDDAGTRTYQLTGPFRRDYLLGLIRGAAIHMATFTSTHFDDENISAVSEGKPALQLDIILDGKALPSVSALKEIFKPIPNQSYALGDFELSQPDLVISDPCYEPGTWCAGTIKAKPGKWICDILIGPTDWYTRVKRLRARHESVSEAVYALEFADTGIDVGVDSGQCGLFDRARYESDVCEESAYQKICVVTLRSECSGGIIPGKSGVVSESGFGDGSYTALTHNTPQGEAVAVQIVFISDDADEEADSTEEREAEQGETGT